MTVSARPCSTTPGPAVAGHLPPAWLSVGWVAGLLTVFTFGNDALASVPVLNAERGLFLLLAALLVARVVTAPRSFPSPGRVEYCMLGYLGVIMLSWLRTLPGKDGEALRQDGVLLLEGFAMPFVAYVLGRAGAGSAERLERTCWALSGGAGAYLAVVGWVEWSLGVVAFEPRSLEIVHPERIGGPFTSSMTYGMVCAILCFVALALAPLLASRAAAAAAIAVAGGLLLATVICAGRGVWLGTGLGLAWLAARQPRSLRLQIAAAGVFFILFGAGLQVLRTRPGAPEAAAGPGPAPLHPLAAPMTTVAGAVPPPIGALSAPAPTPPRREAPLARPSRRPVVRFSERLAAASPIQSRIGAWAVAASMIRDRPLLGFGFASDTFQRLKARYRPAWDLIPRQWADWPALPHNEFVHLLVTCGLLGLGAYLLLLGALWSDLARAARSGEAVRRAVAAALGAAYLLLLANAQFLDLMYLWQPLVLFFFLAGVLAGQGAPSSGR